MALFFYQFTPLYGHNQPRTDFYGQIPKIAVLPVTEGRILRAYHKNRHFARNRRLHFTGKFQKAMFCPQPRPGILIERTLHDTAFLNKKRIFPAHPSEKSSSQSKIINIIYSLQHRQSFRHGRFRLKKRLESL